MVTKRKTVEELITELKKFDSNLYCYVYEGERTGIAIINSEDEEIGFVDAD